MKNIKIELDKERTMRLDFNALIDFEEKAGVRIDQVGEDFSLRQMRAFLWAALRHEDPDLTEEDVGAMLHLGNVEYVSEKITEVMQKHTPEGESKN